MISSPHRIRRLQWLVSTPAIDQAFLLRQRFCNHWQDELLPAIEAAFDEVNLGDRTLHISKLELHLCVTTLEDLSDRLPDLIQQQLKAQLQALEGQSPDRDRSPCQSMTAQQHTLTTLLHYLRTGSLPWETTHHPPADITTKLQEACQQHRSLLLSQLPLESIAYYFRLLQLTPPAQWADLGAELSDRLPTAIRPAILQILIVLSRESTHLTHYCQLNLAAMVLSESLKSPTGLLDRLLAIAESTLSVAEHRTLSNIIASLPAAAIAFPPDPTQLELTSTSPDKALEIRDNPPLPVPDLLAASPEDKGFGVKVNPALSAIAPAADFSLPTRYAGLLLACPFLPRLLETTGIKNPQDADIPAAQLPRAAALLHYLATGDEALFEHELTLIKVLLGRDPNQPLLVAAGLLQPDDKAETEALLQSLLNYWEALKTTSIDGLRSSFLQRSGLLRDRDNGWWVQVESKPYDMLLNQLPWSISVVKLPWMQRPIYSEWQTL
ncbi:MAG TPA: contractile injection system tape measure protein [Trichocoleus sp.]|jgi:hypothetical protein